MKVRLDEEFQCNIHGRRLDEACETMMIEVNFSEPFSFTRGDSFFLHSALLKCIIMKSRNFSSTVAQDADEWQVGVALRWIIDPLGIFRLKLDCYDDGNDKRIAVDDISIYLNE